MYNIHSFLQNVQDKMKSVGHDSCRTCTTMTAYSLAAAILVMGTDSFIGNSKQPIYIKAESVENVLEKEAEGTAEDAQIQLDYEAIKNIVLEVQKLQNNEEETQVTALEEKMEVLQVPIELPGGEAEPLGVEVEEKANQANEIQEQGLDEIVNQYGAEEEVQEKVIQAREIQEQGLTEVFNQYGAEEEVQEKVIQANEIQEQELKQTSQYSGDQIAILERIVEAEATGEDILGKMLVANVVLNRVKDNEFPNTIEGVVFESKGGRYQFSPIRDKRYWSVTITDETKRAVQRVLSGEDNSNGALYFMARSISNSSNVAWFDQSLTKVMQHGVHEFFK